MLEDYKIFVEGILIETNRKISFPLYLDLFFPTNFRSHESPQMALLYMDIKLPPPIISSFSKPAKRRNVVILMTDTRTMRMQINQKKLRPHISSSDSGRIRAEKYFALRHGLLLPASSGGTKTER